MKKSLITAIAVSALSLVSAQAVAKESVPKKKINPVIHVCKKTDKSIDALACNIYKEGRGEIPLGQLGIGYVTMNRLDHDAFPSSVKTVVYQKKQFSWTNSGTNIKIRDAEAWEKSKKLAWILYALKTNPYVYKMLDPTHGATYFHTLQVKPYWSRAAGFKETVTIGNHKFYKLEKKDG